MECGYLGCKCNYSTASAKCCQFLEIRLIICSGESPGEWGEMAGVPHNAPLCKGVAQSLLLHLHAPVSSPRATCQSHPAASQTVSPSDVSVSPSPLATKPISARYSSKAESCSLNSGFIYSSQRPQNNFQQWPSVSRVKWQMFRDIIRFLCFTVHRKQNINYVPWFVPHYTF